MAFTNLQTRMTNLVLGMSYKLILSADGKIESLIDTRTNSAVTYTVHVANAPPSDALDKNIIASRSLEDVHIRLARHRLVGVGLGIPPHRVWLSSAAHSLR